jgi:hypothetical protein
MSGEIVAASASLTTSRNVKIYKYKSVCVPEILTAVMVSLKIKIIF